MERRYDFLIVGSGIAGLFFALKVSQMNPNSRVAIVTKKGETDTSTNRAQGGIAAVTQGTDSFEAHVADTLKAGAGLCDKEVVEKIVEAAPSVIKELVDFGVRFTRSDEGFHLGREGGHSAPRVVHAQDLTGREIERALLKACRSMPNVDIFRDHMVLELITYEEAGRRYCGGGFVFCDLDSHDGLCRRLANLASCVVVSVGYRRAPEHRWPTAAEDIYAAIVERMPTVSLDTVYRTLGLFEQHAVLVKLWGPGGRCRYDPNVAPHHHLVCDACGAIEDFAWPHFDRLTPPEDAAQWGTVSRVQVEVHGLCRDCATRD